MFWRQRLEHPDADVQNSGGVNTNRNSTRKKNAFGQTLVHDESKMQSLLEKTKIVDTLRPLEFDFGDLVPQEEIERDIATVKKLEAQWEQEGALHLDKFKNLATLFERIIQMELDHIIPGATTTTTSKFDDYINGIDAVSTFDEDDEKTHLGLAIDVTFTQDSSGIVNKLNRIKNEIVHGRLGQVKYFEDEDGNKMSLKLPRVVIGADITAVEEYITLFGSHLADKRERLNHHPMQAKIILEIMYQLQYFYTYAKENQQSEVSEYYAQAFNNVLKVYEARREFITQHYESMKQDRVFELIEKSVSLES